jgi:RNA polymerase sigma factor (sigma-70 family)
MYNENIDFVIGLVKNRLYPESIQDLTDCVHDVFLSAMQSKEIQNHPNARGWLCLSVKNVTKRYNERHLNSLLGREIAENDIIVEDFSLQSDENFLFKDAFDKDVIKETLLSLSPREKHFYELRYKRELSYKEISTQMGKTETSLWALNLRLERKVRKFIKKFLEIM